MFAQIINYLTAFITHTISASGYGGVALLMAIESAAMPLPSEIIMPFAGSLVNAGRFNLWLVALAAAFGSIAGSAATYYLGRYLGRPCVEKYGRYLLISKKDLQRADKFFAKYGNFSALVGRLLPVVRTFISIPAGIEKLKIGRFLIYSFAGSFIWSLFLAYFGMKLGQNWQVLQAKFHYLDVYIALSLVLLLLWWVVRHFRHSREK